LNEEDDNDDDDCELGLKSMTIRKQIQ